MILKYEDFATNKNIMNEIIKRFDLKIENEKNINFVNSQKSNKMRRKTL